MKLIVIALLIVCGALAWWYARPAKEPLSDERGCRWDPVHSIMRCGYS